jgi:DNA polymerase-1
VTLAPASPEAFDLLMRGSRAMARLEERGLHIDTAYLDRAIADVKSTINDTEERLRTSAEMTAWQKRFGNDTNPNSNLQLGTVIFDVLGHRRNPTLARRTGRDRRDEKDARSKRPTNEEYAFEHLQLPFTRDLFALKKLRRALGTNLMGFKREVVDGVLHTFLDLHTTESYRSSSSRINFHNQPRRNKLISKIVRTCIVPRPGMIFVEPDYSSQEVRVNACYSQDPRLMDYVGGGGDMHRDRGMELFKLSEVEMGDSDGPTGKAVRDVAKNKFVFPNFYGSFYCQTAPDVWDLATRLSIKTCTGVPILEHLRQKGITRLGDCDPDKPPERGTFEEHVKEVERNMWGNVFRVHSKWKQDWWEAYQRDGGVLTLTGFLMAGIFRRNQILADPIQGSAFHCLLWALIKIDDEFIRRGMRARVVLQIHDSLLVECPESELSDVIAVVERWALVEVRRAWKWIVVPLAVSFEIARDNWFEKSKLEVSS